MVELLHAPEGGSFRFTVDAANNTSDSLSLQSWASVTGPGEFTRTVFGPEAANFAPTERVPGSLSAEAYTYNDLSWQASRSDFTGVSCFARFEHSAARF